MIPFVIQSSGIKSKDLIVSRWPDIELLMNYYTHYSTIMRIILAIILIILQNLNLRFGSFFIAKQAQLVGAQ